MPSETNGLTFDTLRDANLRRLMDTPKFAKCRSWTPAQWMMALVGEIGEAANILKKVERGDFEMHGVRDIIADELADVQVYLDLLCSACGINLSAATIAKFNATSEKVGSGFRIDNHGWSEDRSSRQEVLP